jgi:hypothetical protein
MLTLAPVTVGGDSSNKRLEILKTVLPDELHHELVVLEIQKIVFKDHSDFAPV